jgi:hypothetical protein
VDARAQRLARNETFFRDVNDRIEDTAAAFGPDARYDFICECAEITCDDVITLTLAEYAQVREQPTRFVVKAGHEVPEYEAVVDRLDGSLVIEKLGEAGEAAAELDSRRDDGAGPDR